jgi:beta-lactamase class A
MYLLKMVDEKLIDLDEIIMLNPDDWRPGTSLLSKRAVFAHIPISLRNCLSLMMEESDTVAAGIILQRVGGVKNVTQWILDQGITDMRLDRNLLLDFRGYDGIIKASNKYMNREQYEQAKKQLTTHQIHQAHQEFLEHPNAYATPRAMNSLLKILLMPNVLSKNSTDLLMTCMRLSHTGMNRIAQYLPPQIDIAQKTGTLHNLDISPQQQEPYIAVNNVGILTLPNKEHIILSIFTTSPLSSVVVQERAIAEAARLIVDYVSS